MKEMIFDQKILAMAMIFAQEIQVMMKNLTIMVKIAIIEQA